MQIIPLTNTVTPLLNTTVKEAPTACKAGPFPLLILPISVASVRIQNVSWWTRSIMQRPPHVLVFSSELNFFSYTAHGSCKTLQLLATMSKTFIAVIAVHLDKV